MKIWPKAGHQSAGERRVVIHWRTSKLGKKFQAGSVQPKPKFEDKMYVAGKKGVLKWKRPKLIQLKHVIVPRPLNTKNPGRMKFIGKLVQAMRSGKLASVKVIKKNGTFILHDGRHRLLAAQKLGYSKVWVQKIQPTIRQKGQWDRYFKVHPVAQMKTVHEAYMKKMRFA